MNGTVFASALSSVTGSNASVNHNAAANTMQLRPPPSILTSHAFSPASASGLDGQPHEELYLLESAARPPPPPPAPPSTPVIKQAMTQKHHNQLLQQLPKKLANGTYQFWRAPDYMWLDTAGRPTSPPPPPHTPQGSSAQIARKVAFDLVVNDNLGLMIRGGIEYGLGIYITGVDEESAAFRHGLRVGDEILQVNGLSFDRVTHDEAVKILKSSHRLSFLLNYVGKVPHSSLIPNATKHVKVLTPNSEKKQLQQQQLLMSSITNMSDASEAASVKTPSSVHALLTSTSSLPISIPSHMKNPEGSSFQAPRRSPVPPPAGPGFFREAGNLPRRYSCGDRDRDPVEGAEDPGGGPLGGRTPGGSSFFPGSLGPEVPITSAGFNRIFTSVANSVASSFTAGLNGFPENRANAPARAGGHNHNRATGSSSSTTSVVGPGIVGEAVSPELSMVLEKAVVLLNNTEFSALRRILAEYESGELNIDAFAENLIHLISDQEKTSFFTEIREIVRQEDLIRFDRLIFGRGGNAIFDQLLQEHQRPQRAQQHQQHPQKQQQPPQQPQQASQQPPPVANSGPPEYTPRPSQNGHHRQNGSVSRASLGSASGGAGPSRSPMHIEEDDVFVQTNNGGPLVDNMYNDFGERRVPPMYNGEPTTVNATNPIENGYLEDDGPVTASSIPLYIRRDGREPQRAAIHPSIAGFPSHDKRSRVVTFKGCRTVRIPKCCSSLGIAIEGGTNTLQPLPRIISIQPSGAAFQSDLRVGQLISEVDGYKLTGLPHQNVAKLIAGCFAKRDRNYLTMVVQDQKLTPAEMRRSFMQPQ